MSWLRQQREQIQREPKVGFSEERGEIEEEKKRRKKGRENGEIKLRSLRGALNLWSTQSHSTHAFAVPQKFASLSHRATLLGATQWKPLLISWAAVRRSYSFISGFIHDSKTHWWHQMRLIPYNVICCTTDRLFKKHLDESWITLHEKQTLIRLMKREAEWYGGRLCRLSAFT